MLYSQGRHSYIVGCKEIASKESLKFLKKFYLGYVCLDNTVERFCSICLNSNHSYPSKILKILLVVKNW